MSFKHGASVPADNKGGTCTNIIDLANGAPMRGGLDPEVPQILTPVQVTGRLLTGHTADLADPAAPVIVRECDVIAPGGARVAEGRCPRCIARVTFSPVGADTLMILEHAPRCPELGALLAEAGVAS